MTPKIKILGSSSKGNCYLLETEKETLIIEAGIPFQKIKEGLNFDFSKVVGCLVTHEHGDHSKSVNSMTKQGVDVYLSNGTLKATNKKDIRLFDDNFRINKLTGKKVHINGEDCLFYTPFDVGGFRITPFETKHDANEPLGFLIDHEEFGRLLFATDTYYVKWIFKNIDHIFIECNYIKEILDKNVEAGFVDRYQEDRLLKSHFELSNVIDFLKTNIAGNFKNLVLLHLSDRNSCKETILSEIKSETGVDAVIASNGIEVNLKISEF